MKANYHTHHYLCNHAQGNTEDYVKEAIKSGFKELGMSDHAPNPRIADKDVRMKPSEFKLYLEDIEAAQEKYKGQIKILKGLEVEYFYDHDEYYDFLRKNVDYLIHGQHYISMTNQMDNLISGFALKTKEQIKKYATYMEEAIKSGYFDILAHPDLYLNSYEKFDKYAEDVAHRICKSAKKHNIILEYNATGYRRGGKNTENGYMPNYPRREFWKIVKEYECRTILGSDAHNPKYLYDDTVKKAEEDYINLDLNIVEFLELKQ
ncbi:MAG: histidinol-phosphatase [Candidatus Izimaplasma sp.]|nr:histidinol-phosphatase [Candidatus Izimaplasma bacterium]